MKNLNQEIIDFIDNFDNNKDNLKGIFTYENSFFDNYNCNLYVYIRVSTERQEFGRQLIELYEWAKKKNITIYIKNIFCDKYTGKSLKRDGYQELKQHIKSNDYLVTSNLSRLGRNWDDIKKEWANLEYNGIKKIITDNDNLSIELPNEIQKEMNLNRKMIQDITFSACLYSACQKIQEVSESTKAGLKKAKINGTSTGRPIGKPKGKTNTKENFVLTLEYMALGGLGQYKATLKTNFPIMSFKNYLKKCYLKYNTKDYKKILENVKGDDTNWLQF